MFCLPKTALASDFGNKRASGVRFARASLVRGVPIRSPRINRGVQSRQKGAAERYSLG